MLVVALAVPLVGLVVLLAAPDADLVWQHNPTHFWLVLGAAAVNVAVAQATGAAARARGDARVYLVSLAFLAAALFLGLHALATPGVLLDAGNTGFAVASPTGLLLASGFAVASSLDLSGSRGTWVVRRASVLTGVLVGLALVWAVWSLSALAPLGDPDVPERNEPFLVVVGVLGIVGYAVAVVRYLALHRVRRQASMLVVMAVAFVLLAEAMVAVAASRSWHLSWWEWHILMVVAFALVAWSARREWHEERFADLYLDETAAGTREVSVLFADLQGFTTFSEQHGAAEVSAMLNQYFQVAIPPIVERLGGSVDRIIGDAVMVVFNRRGDQPDHAHLATRAGLDIQARTAAIADAHPDWPRFRVGVNTGEAVVAVLGARGGRTHTVIGDVVNLASRIEGQAPVGGVAVGPDTYRRLPPGAVTRSLGLVTVKGKQEPVEVHVVEDLPADHARPGAPPDGSPR